MRIPTPEASGTDSRPEMRTAVAPGDIALTYDDGPDPVWTEKILEVLRNHRAVATFFVQGSTAAEHPEVIGTIAEGGHEVGLHCFHHTRHSTMSAEEVRSDAEAGLRVLGSLGIAAEAWRPPWGDESAATAPTAKELGLELWGWSDDTHDWRGDSWEQMLGRFPAAGPKGGGVVLMHDGIGPGARRADPEQTLRLTERLLGAIATTGLRPVTVSREQAADRA